MASSWLPFAGAVILPYTVSTIESIKMKDEIRTWYAHLKRAPWNPPNWLFGPVWTILYGMMGYASYLVWREGELSESAEVHAKVHWALTLYGIQLLLNWIWSPLFFNFHKVGLALLEFVALLVAVEMTILEFYAVLPFAAYLLVPYLCWGLYAITLNAYIWLYNDSKTTKQN